MVGIPSQRLDTRSFVDRGLTATNTRRLRGALAPLLRGPPLSKDAVSRLVGRLREDFAAWGSARSPRTEGALSVFIWLVSAGADRQEAGAGASVGLR